ncbi:hypothetical protein KO02_16840 [Sphingobacterium sp. ML3W]|uniref:hypothetical protein n=1 Tax=Sphingobacterium sp. ML3W TaxID=1538644 RepID=UPI0004F67F6C|nr:hypothetical protein [Sphingobacterium sp. ML3W]AIM38158.1 hypothetical protein KO02_16840 [Sphingobacterium sp. ML3W]
MNLDELKSAWNADNTDNVRIPSRIKKLGAAKLPLDKLKRNMKNEWYIQIVAIVFLAFFPWLLRLHPAYHIIYYASYTFLVLISAYYLNLFRLFYNKIDHYSMGTKDSLLEIYYEFKLNIERYHAFGFLLLPMAIVASGLYFNSRLIEKEKDFLTLPANTKVYLIILSIVVCLTAILSILLWTRYFYGTYVKQLKAILDELKEEDLRDGNLKMNAMQTNDTKEIQPKKGE